MNNRRWVAPCLASLSGQRLEGQECGEVALEQEWTGERAQSSVSLEYAHPAKSGSAVENKRTSANLLAFSVLSFRLRYSGYFGGVTALSREQFFKVNGFSNNYWGWGGEDDDLRLR